MTKTIRWGIIGPGKIAHKFAQDLSISRGGRLAAVASRSSGRAAAFARQYGADLFYDSYDALLQDASVDAVYIATPHVFHKQWVNAAQQHHKAVLCEKPLGMSAYEVQQMIQNAQTTNTFLMEALWSRFLPATAKVIDILQSGVIGQVHTIEADFGFKADYQPEGRLFNKSLGGGALLDIGIYPLFICQLILGRPVDISASARFAPTGADTFCAIRLDYEGAVRANLQVNLEAHTPTEAWIRGSRGSIRMHARFHETQKITWITEDESTTYTCPYRGQGFVHEIEEVHRRIAAGHRESQKHTHRDSLALAHLLDRVRQTIGLHYTM